MDLISDCNNAVANFILLGNYIITVQGFDMINEFNEREARTPIRISNRYICADMGIRVRRRHAETVWMGIDDIGHGYTYEDIHT